MMGTIEDLERHFESAHHTYVTNTESRTTKFKALTQKDKENALDIQRKAQRLLKLQEAVNNWKMKISANCRECEERNKLLREERESIGKHFAELKRRMNKFRGHEARFLSDLTTKIRKAMQELEAKQKQAERVLKIAELNRKMETEQEKILPFEPVPPLAGEGTKVPSELRADANMLSAYAKAPDGGAVEEHYYLDRFFKRFNKVQLDCMALKGEHRDLTSENQDLRNILTQYLDGISVTEDVLAKHNPLLVVNNRTNIVHRMPLANMSNIPAVEGNTVVSYTRKMHQPMVQTDLGQYW